MFRFLAGVEVIPQILGVTVRVHGVDLLLEQLADSVRSHLMEHGHAALPQQLPTGVHGVEDKGEVVTAEGLLLVGAVDEIVRLIVEHDDDDHIVGHAGWRLFVSDATATPSRQNTLVSLTINSHNICHVISLPNH